MFNLVVLTGRLTDDPKLKKTPSDVSVTNFSIAVQRAYKLGEEAVTDFINIVAWRSTAEFICKYFKKGKMIGIEGSIQTRKWVDNDGNNRTAFEVFANNVQFVENKKEDNIPTTANTTQGNLDAVVDDTESDSPFFEGD